MASLKEMQPFHRKWRSAHWKHCSFSPGFVVRSTIDLCAGFAREAQSEMISPFQLCPDDIIDIVAEYFSDWKLTPLLTAVYCGYRQATIQLWPLNKDDVTEDSLTALHLAAQLSWEPIVHALIELGANVNVVSKSGETPLMTAVIHGHSGIVKLLSMASDIDMNTQRKSDGATALFIACKNDEAECVRNLLKNHSIIIDKPTIDGRTPRSVASQTDNSIFGHTEIEAILIAHSRKMHKMNTWTHGY